MASVAQRLEVLFIPHQVRVSAMRPDVVHIGSRCEASSLHALGAERMLSEESYPDIAPAIPVAALRRRPLSSVRRFSLKRFAFLFRSSACLAATAACRAQYLATRGTTARQPG